MRPRQRDGGWALRCYALLLYLVPREFRERHGGAMTEAFVGLHAAAREEGPRAVLRLWLRESCDLARTGLTLRMRGRLGRHGNRAIVAEASPRTSGLGTLRDDLHLAIRATARHAGFVTVAACTLALGVGATTAMYSVLEAVVLDPLPFPASDRLVTLHRTFGDPGSASVRLALEPDDVEALRDQWDVFDGIESMSTSTVTLTGAGEPDRLLTVEVSAGLPSLMQVSPVLGRTFLREEIAGDGRRVLLLSHALWRGRFGSRPDVLGETLQLDGHTWTIIGVMPREAVRPDGNPRVVDLWRPLPERDPLRTWIARLAPNVAVEVAAARVDTVVRRADAERPGDRPMAGTALAVRQPGPLHEHLRMLMIAVTLLTLVACVNVSNLLLQRASGRRRETAVRAALGATRARLVRQLLLESALLAIAGGIIGAGLAHLGLRALLALRPERLVALHSVRIDGGALLFCLAIAAVAGMLFGLLPALHGSRAAATAALGRTGRDDVAPSGRFGWALVTSEVAVSFALLIGATLVISSLRELSTRDPGFRADGLVAVEVRLPSWRYGEESQRAAAFARIVDDVRRLPTVQAVSLADGVPPRLGGGMFGHVHVEGREPEAEPSVFHSVNVDAQFVRTLGQPVVAGRAFVRGDERSDAHPVLLTRSAAARLFPGEDPIGRRFRMEGPPDYTVVGVVGDVLATGLADTRRTPLAYWPLQRVRDQMMVVIRSDRTDAAFLLELSGLLRRAEPDAIVDIATVSELLSASLARERFTTSLLSTFATLALLLAAVGLYGVLSQVVIARTREIGVRMALGADAARIRRLIVGKGLAATMTGLALGALLASAGLRLLRSEVFGLGESQPVAYLAAAAVLLATAFAAMLLPATRAARLDPMHAIRVD